MSTPPALTTEAAIMLRKLISARVNMEWNVALSSTDLEQMAHFCAVRQETQIALDRYITELTK